MPVNHQEIITHLNAVLQQQLGAINQYFLHARMLKHSGKMALADHEYKASIDAMKYADMLVEHILSLNGKPDLRELASLSLGDDEKAMLQSDLMVAEEAVKRLKAAMALCEGEAASLSLLERIMGSQQGHIDFIRNEFNNGNMKECA